MKRKYLNRLTLTICLQLIFAFAFSQSKISLAGAIKDSSTQKPLQYATVELYRHNQLTQAIKSVYTNDKGKFFINGVDTGNYTLVFSHTGFADKQQDIIIGS